MRDKWNLRKEDRQNWLVFGGSVLISFLLSIVVILLDTRTIPLLDNLPEWVLTNVSMAKEVLSALTGTLFAVTTFSFSAMLTVVSLYSSNFSPRVVENFLLNRVALRTLGIFLGGFVYSLSSLVFMKDLSNDSMVISATMAWMYAIAEEVFDKHIDYFEGLSKLEHLPDLDTPYQYTVKANTNAYIDYIRFEELKDLCEEYEAVCVPQVRMGTFISRHQPVAVFYTNQKDEKRPPNLEVFCYGNRVRIVWRCTRFRLLLPKAVPAQPHTFGQERVR